MVINYCIVLQDKFPNYAIYPDGRIWSIESKQFMSPSGEKNGYRKVTLVNHEGARKNIRVHRIIAEAFIPNPLNLATVNHKDRNKYNNNVSNLEWASGSDQNNHVIATGRKTAKRAVNQYDLEGNFIKTFDSVSEAAISVDRGVTSIIQACYKETNTCAGHKWKYRDEKPKFVPIDGELWKEIQGYSGYWISSLGRFWSQNSGRLLTPILLDTGYFEYYFKRDQGRKAHLLVAETFLIKPESNVPLLVNHKDGNKVNNCLDNLEYITYSENVRHAHENRLIKTSLRVIQFSLNGEKIRDWYSLNEIERSTNIKASKMSKICHAGGGIINGSLWKFLEE